MAEVSNQLSQESTWKPGTVVEGSGQVIITDRPSVFVKLHHWECFFTYEEQREATSSEPSNVWKALLFEKRIKIQEWSWLEVFCNKWIRSVSSSSTSLDVLSTLQVKGYWIMCISLNCFEVFKLLCKPIVQGCNGSCHQCWHVIENVVLWAELNWKKLQVSH